MSGRYFFPNIGTPDTLHRGAFLTYAGLALGENPGPAGTGSQLYSFGALYGVTERLQVGIGYETFDDPVAISGAPGNEIGIFDVMLQAKYQLYDTARVKVAAEASVETYSFQSDFWGTRGAPAADTVVGSLHLPVSINVTDALKVHVSPGVSFFTDNFNGVPFYGTIYQIGGGVSYRFSERAEAYATVNVPFGDGGNSIGTNGAVSNVPVWAVGGTFNVTPKVALEGYVTNGFGNTPATRVTTFFPGGDDLVLGARLSYTPGNNSSYRTSFRDVSNDMTDRQRHLQFHQGIMSGADTLDPGYVSAYGFAGPQDYGGGGVSIGLEQDFEFGLRVDRYSNDGSLGPNSQRPGVGTRVSGTVKLRILDQNNGSPFSMSALAELGTGTGTTLGTIYGSLPISYQVNDAVAVSFEPKFGNFVGSELLGATAGVNIEPWDGVELMAQAGAVDGGSGAVWSAGARVHAGFAPIAFEVQASNTIGDYGVGSLIAQEDVRYSAGVRVTLDGKSILGSLF
ncbi:hypothetical protein AIOL_002480 [Candidatus Rhodobacter oscarellae]|uniref:Porin n=1 Tax=Candidatus Rhodobacter oscarellae TaxID=1675527 RepID=A0A0J9E3Z9_9RHOB|nr:hypothetical protein AIOL_002480 [Candidatus Rhodobacter lobularis]